MFLFRQIREVFFSIRRVERAEEVLGLRGTEGGALLLVYFKLLLQILALVTFVRVGLGTTFVVIS